MNRQKDISGKELEGSITSDEILGKDVIDSDGRFIGIAEKVFIHPDNLDFVGISVDKGFLKKGFSIGRDFIERVAAHAIFLNISVAYELKGMRVFDIDGKLVGRIKTVALIGSGNDIDAINVLVPKSYFGVEELSISSKFLDKIGYNVLLNVSRDDILAQTSHI